MNRDWQQKRTLEYLAEGGEGLADKDGGMLTLIGSMGVFLNPAQTSALFSFKYICLDTRPMGFITITDAGRKALPEY